MTNIIVSKDLSNNNMAIKYLKHQIPELKINDSEITEKTEIKYTNNNNPFLRYNNNANNNPFGNNYTYSKVVNRSRSSSFINPFDSSPITTVYSNNNTKNNKNTIENNTLNNNTMLSYPYSRRRSYPRTYLSPTLTNNTMNSVNSSSDGSMLSFNNHHIITSNPININTNNDNYNDNDNINNTSISNSDIYKSRRHTISSISYSNHSLFDSNGLPKLTLLNSIDLPSDSFSTLKNIDIIDHYLHNAGFLPAKIIYKDTNGSNDCIIRMATTSNDVLIPTISSNEEEYLSRLNSHNNHNDNNNNSNIDYFDIDGTQELISNDLSTMTISDTENDDFSSNSSIMTGSRSRAGSTRRSSFSLSRQDIPLSLSSTFSHQNTFSIINGMNNNFHEIAMNDNNLCYFKLAIIVSIKETTQLESIQLELSSRVNIKYLNGKNQYTKVGELNWNLNRYNFNLYLPPTLKSVEDDVIENFDNIIQWKLFKNINYKKRLAWTNENNSPQSDFWKDSLFQKLENLNTSINSISEDNLLLPGDYVFLIPVIFNNHIPETIAYPSGKLDYFIRLASFKKVIKTTDDTMKSNNINKNTVPKDQQVGMSSKLQPSVANKNISQNLSTNNLSIFKKMRNHFRSNSTPSAPHILITDANNDNDNSFITRTYTTTSSVSDFDSFSSLKYSNNTGPSVDITDLNSQKSLIPKTDISYFINEIYLQNKLNVIRTPPLISVSTANKPVYINKVWDNSLNYEISLPNKYIPLDANIPVTVKLSPLIKNLSLIKIGIGISERIDYVNNKDKSMSFKETDHVLENSSNPYYHVFNSKKKKQRLLLLYELRSEQTGPRALREEIVTNCIDHNLLSYYRTKNSNNNSYGNGDAIVEPIELKTRLKFPGEKAYVLSDNNQNLSDFQETVDLPYGIEGYDLYDKFDNLESFYPTTPNGTLPDVGNVKDKNHGKNSIVNFFFGGISGNNNTLNNNNNNHTTNNKGRNANSLSNESKNILTHKRHKTQIDIFSKKNIAMINTKMYSPKRGLYIDSTHFSTLRCKHKLEIIMKLEKCDENKQLRQYEVIVNTPIYLMSGKCTNENLVLPVYDVDGNTYYQPNRDIVDTLSSSVSTSLYPPSPPPTFEESLLNPLVFKSNLNVLHNNSHNTCENNITHHNNDDSNNSHIANNSSIPKTPFYLNTDFGNLDGLLNSYTRSSHYRRTSVGSSNLTPPLERIPSPPPAYMDVFPAKP
ncbi:Csr2p PWA37_004354 [Arxiozyma heterogenica]|uniref:Arrestin C-terminal-like domain-containing protein n=1 Tax=Arxiozyma heterogenica TaxID=278026 RepID=A0AAN7W1U8_9SACH|nr:hypothetical protein RI543_003370 [Kazachstania heterogenica]